MLFDVILRWRQSHWPEDLQAIHPTCCCSWWCVRVTHLHAAIYRVPVRAIGDAIRELLQQRPQWNMLGVGVAETAHRACEKAYATERDVNHQATHANVQEAAKLCMWWERTCWVWEALES